MTLFGGLICLTYERYQRRSFDKQVNMSKSRYRSSYESARHENADPITRVTNAHAENERDRAQDAEDLCDIYPSKENVAPGVHLGGGGVNPTVALQKSQ